MYEFELNTIFHNYPVLCKVACVVDIEVNHVGQLTNNVNGSIVAHCIECLLIVHKGVYQMSVCRSVGAICILAKTYCIVFGLWGNIICRSRNRSANMYAGEDSPTGVNKHAFSSADE